MHYSKKRITGKIQMHDATYRQETKSVEQIIKNKSCAVLFVNLSHILDSNSNSERHKMIYIILQEDELYLAKYCGNIFA